MDIITINTFSLTPPSWHQYETTAVMLNSFFPANNASLYNLMIYCSEKWDLRKFKQIFLKNLWVHSKEVDDLQRIQE